MSPIWIERNRMSSNFSCEKNAGWQSVLYFVEYFKRFEVNIYLVFEICELMAEIIGILIEMVNMKPGNPEVN